ncbi:MAG TPA: hypothetical protein VF186_09755 [Gaiellaceae bacterium]|jgi:hypothetical protein
MEIGDPRRIYRVEPLRDPVPRREQPAPPPPVRRRVEPEKVPAK